MNWRISSPAGTIVSRVNAANALFNKALAWLQEHIEPAYFYTLSLSKVESPLRVGELLRVVFSKWVDNYHAVDVDADLRVLEAGPTIDNHGGVHWRVKVATVSRFPESDPGAVMATVAKLATATAMPTTSSGATDANPGIVTQLTTVNGLVTSTAKQTGVEDGDYDLGTTDHIRIKGGVITKIW
jgi:hypothetical protein